MSEEVKYNLYVSEVSTAIPIGVKYSLVPNHHQYRLLYTDKALTAKDGFAIIPPNTQLNRQERAWLFQSKVAVNAEYLKKSEQDYAAAMSAFLDVFEQELKKEAGKEGA